MLFYYSLTAAFLALFFVVYRYRTIILQHVLPDQLRSRFPTLTQYAPLSTFAEQASAGMTSYNFDIEANINSGDSRTGLDEQATQEIQEIMRRDRVNFDQARLIRQNRILARNGIDSSGMPLDSKAITRLS